MNRDMLSRRLMKRGFRVEIAVNGQESVEKTLQLLPDLILMDMNLPIMDGWEATRKLKSEEQSKNIPIIALTAYAMLGDKQKALAAGCDDYDTKPVDLPRLLEKIQNQISK
jgi:CheY-like chemotaxis protein